jgi:hypothetical protein
MRALSFRVGFLFHERGLSRHRSIILNNSVRVARPPTERSAHNSSLLMTLNFRDRLVNLCQFEWSARGFL